MDAPLTLRLAPSQIDPTRPGEVVRICGCVYERSAVELKRRCQEWSAKPASTSPGLTDHDLALLREQAAEANPAYWVPKLLDEIARLRELIATER